MEPTIPPAAPKVLAEPTTEKQDKLWDAQHKPTEPVKKEEVSRLNDYYKAIWAKIKKEFTLPRDLPKGKTDLETVIVIIVERDGKIQKSWFEKKSGNALFDQSAMQTIKKAEPLPPIPKEFSDETFEIGIRFYPDDSYSLVATSAHAQEPFKFNYRAIPFGETIENVLKRVERAQVKEDEGADFQVAGNYKLNSYFHGGLYKDNMFGTTCFNSMVAKKFTVKYDGWENIEQITLFFSKGFGSKLSGNLFMVEKTLKAPEGNIENVFNGMKGQISKGLGFSPTIHKVEYEDFQMKMENTYEPALVAVGSLKDRKVFLLVRKNLFSTGEPEILYLSNKEWQTYVNSCNVTEKEKEKKGGKGAKDF